MPTNIPVLPIALGGLARALAAAAVKASRRLKAFARARRHRREATALASLDQHMLRDMGLTSADLRDAFSSPFWEDPTAILRERAIEQRMNRPRNIAVLKWRDQEPDRTRDGYVRPCTGRPARQAM